MIPLPTLALFAAAAAALVLTPGPAVLFIVARSLHQGRKAGLVSVAGIAAGSMVHIAAAVLGVSALLASSPVVYGAVRWLGAGYLVWLGVRTLRGGGDGGPSGEPAAPVPLRRLFAQGFVVNVLNPKTALFFLAFLPQFADPSRGSVALQMLLLGGVFELIGVTSDSAYALLAGTFSRRLGSTPASRRGARVFSGCVYVALGVGAALATAR